MWPEYVGPASGVRVTIAVGVTQPSPARKGWEPNPKARFLSAELSPSLPPATRERDTTQFGIRKW